MPVATWAAGMTSTIIDRVIEGADAAGRAPTGRSVSYCDDSWGHGKVRTRGSVPRLALLVYTYRR